jgi:hypothetical protein
MSCCHAFVVLQTPIRDELTKMGNTHFLQLARAAGITEPAPSAMLTIFAPTNEVGTGRCRHQG